jgi:cyclophilin family peptidyl-prolyl cis-trans isomerase
MKNLAIATCGLIIVIVLVFLFSSKQKGNDDTFVPSPIPLESPKLGNMINNEATKSAVNLPFPVLTKEEIDGKKVRIKTVKEDIVFELFADSPIASSNFIYLANKKFYDGLTFHRREERFVIQGGDPRGNGTGGPGYQFPDEPITRDYTRGIVAMANAGPNTNGSQFFIMLADTPLPKQYTIFGNVIEGMEVVDQIKVGDAMEKVIIE